jgi:hypothetical protein
LLSQSSEGLTADPDGSILLFQSWRNIKTSGLGRAQEHLGWCWLLFIGRHIYDLLCLKGLEFDLLFLLRFSILLGLRELILQLLDQDQVRLYLNLLQVI